MISPGCSFQFDGLKQVLRNIRPGIDDSLKKVVNLKVNYRVTKDILKVSNVSLFDLNLCPFGLSRQLNDRG